MKSALVLVAASALGIGAASTVHAVIVTDGGANTLFQDNFEAGTDGAAPVAQVGTWSKSGTVAVGSGSTPAAFEGVKYLQITRPGTAFADFGMRTSGTIHAEFMLHIKSADFASHGVQIMLRNDALSAYSNILSVQSDGLVRYYDGSGYVDSLVSASLDTWQKWTIDVDLSTDTYQFTVAGQQGLTSPDALHEGATDLRYLLFGSGGGTNPQYLLDAVPEPASALSLVALGGLALRRRR